MSERLFPVSLSQRMFWLLDQLEPDVPAYNLPRALHLEGPLNVEALRGVFRALLRRHDVLRTSFIAQDGELFQCVDEHIEFDLPMRDLSGLPASSRKVEALAIASEERRKPFDLERAPLLRATLLRLGPDEHVLVLVMHHIITDGWSMGILFKEIAQFYRQLALGRPPQLAQLPIQYADFACQQREQLADQALQKDLEYWENKLRGCPTLLELPTDRPRPAVQSHHGSMEGLTIGKTLTRRMKDLCAREGATLYMGLLAVFQVLLWRYSGKDDILVGTPLAGRDDPELADLIGCFVNTCVIRGDLTGNPGFQEFLARVRVAALEAYAHQRVPIEQLLAKLKCERTPSHTPLFQVMFILQNAPKQVIRFPGLVIDELELDSGLAKFDITLEVVEQEGLLYCQFEYRSELFEGSTIQRMALHFHNLLESAIENPSCPIARLSMLEEREREEMLFAWNATSLDYPRELTIARAFEEQFRRTPDAIALLDGFQRITYREVERRANQVANALIQRGVRPEMPVGIYMKRSAEAIIAILGAIKAGGLYVPLDISQPKHRLHLLISTGDCRTVLTHRALQHDLPAPVNPILLDLDEALWTKSSGSPPPSPSGQLAYIIFTSGSTGVPKGVVGTHRATMNRLAWMYETYPFSSDEVCCQKTALGFVDSVWEIFGPLLRGIPNVIIPEEVVIDPELLLELLARERVTRIVLVPTLLGVLLEHAPDLDTRAPMLKLWTVSGEYLPLDLAKKFRDVLPEAVLLNLYGSSEVAGDATFYEVGELDGLAAIPIGKPIANTRAYILDDFVQPVPMGVHGTLYVGGDCVSKGYWRRPDLTSERFVPSPFGAKSGTLFVTGDRARFLPDGNLEYLGRLDTQIKLRGFRVELGEIEANLVVHPSVRQATVTVAGHDADTRQLVAYVVGRDGAAPPSRELRDFLGGRLPQYMVPAVFVELAELPLLPSGKVDRGSLPQPPSGIGQAGEKLGPRNDVETRLVSIWRELLGLEELGVTENFFALGGNSLLAMQILARVRKTYEVEISIRSLFDGPSVEELAREIERAKASGAVARTPTIIPRARPSVEEISAELARLSPEQIEMLLQQVRR
jgi:amino acid adenylation domain-containing protein